MRSPSAARCASATIALSESLDDAIEAMERQDSTNVALARARDAREHARALAALLAAEMTKEAMDFNRSLDANDARVRRTRVERSTQRSTLNVANEMDDERARRRERESSERARERLELENARLRKENEVLMNATRAAREEFRRVERGRRRAGAVAEASDGGEAAAEARAREAERATGREGGEGARARTTTYSTVRSLEVREKASAAASAAAAAARRSASVERALDSMKLKTPERSGTEPSGSLPRLPAYLGSPYGNSIASIASSPIAARKTQDFLRRND